MRRINFLYILEFDPGSSASFEKKTTRRRHVRNGRGDYSTIVKWCCHTSKRTGRHLFNFIVFFYWFIYSFVLFYFFIVLFYFFILSFKLFVSFSSFICLVWFCFFLFCFVLFCFVLFALFCFVLFCFVLFCFVLFTFSLRISSLFTFSLPISSLFTFSLHIPFFSPFFDPFLLCPISLSPSRHLPSLLYSPTLHSPHIHLSCGNHSHNFTPLELIVSIINRILIFLRTNIIHNLSLISLMILSACL